jgi:hypothetical protein
MTRWEYAGYIDKQIYRVFKKYIYNGTANVTVWGVLQKHLHLKVCKLSVALGV